VPNKGLRGKASKFMNATTAASVWAEKRAENQKTPQKVYKSTPPPRSQIARDTPTMNFYRTGNDPKYHLNACQNQVF
jgi:hypothetical protein